MKSIKDKAREWYLSDKNLKPRGGEKDYPDDWFNHIGRGEKWDQKA